MTAHRLILFLLTLIPVLLSGQTNEGTEFWFSFLEHRDVGNNTKVVMITSRVNTRGTISAPKMNFNQSFTVKANDVTIVELPAFAEIIGSESINQNGFRVRSTDPVSVYIHQYKDFRAEATVVLPISTIGNAYYALSYTGFTTLGQVYPSEFAVVANEDDSNISIQLSANTRSGRRKGEIINLSLKAGETYQVQGATATDDLSGSFITGDKNFSLFCGNKYSALNCLRSGRDNLLEQAYPIDAWGTQFVAAPFQENIKDVYRILASEDKTSVEVFVSGKQRSYTIDAGQFIEYEEAEIAFIESTKPILIAQYMNQLDCGNRRNGDPSMLYLNTVLQIRDTVTLYNSSFQNIEENFINIIARANDLPNILFDGKALSSLSTTIHKAGRQNEFISATLPVQTGAHTITSSGCGVIAKAYGLGRYESYAYSGGASFNKINANPIPDGGCLNDTVFFNTKLPEERYEVLWVIDSKDSIREHKFTRKFSSLGEVSAELFIYDRCFDQRDTSFKKLMVTLRQSVKTDSIGTHCEGDDIHLSATDVNMAQYEWKGPNDFFSDRQNPVIKKGKPGQSGNYEVIGIVSGCATVPALVSVSIKPAPQPNLGPDAVFCPKSEIHPIISPGKYSSYLWNNGMAAAELVVSAQGPYSVEVLDEFACTASDSIFFTQQCPTDFYIPNIFSPNGDQINDHFGIFGEDIIAFDLRVFDAWGKEVFYSQDEKTTWDGIYKSQPVIEGVYTWVLDLQGYLENGGIFRKSFYGDLTLIR